MRDQSPTTSPPQFEDALGRAWREQRAAVLATLARRLGDLGLAEDAVQEAFAAAATSWSQNGVPERPGAWLTTTAWRKALDGLRKDRFPVERDAQPFPSSETSAVDSRLHADPADTSVDDDVLSLVLTCCHPALSSEAQVALTLRHVAGLSDRQIAARFLVSEPTMSKRLVRARAKIRAARIAFDLPDRTRLHERLSEVHAVVYLVFTEGYLASDDGPAVRLELCEEALWLCRQLHRLVADDAETTGLLALVLLHSARSTARQDGAGRLVPYDEQDRTLWDLSLVDEAKALLARTGHERPGTYQLQAAIALMHAVAPSMNAVPWSRVARLYKALLRATPSPVVAVNQAVAVGRADGPGAGLQALRPVLSDDTMANYLPLHAAHADLLCRAGRVEEAAAAWRAAAALAVNPQHAAELLRRARAATSLAP